MAKVYLFFTAKRAYIRFKMDYIGDVAVMLRSDYLTLKEKTRYHTFTYVGVYGQGDPTEEHDWCTTKFEIVKISIDGETVDFNERALHCIETHPGIKKVNVELKLRSIEDKSNRWEAFTGYEKFDSHYKSFTMSFLTHIDEGDNYIYAELFYRVHYILEATKESAEVVRYHYDRYYNYAKDFKLVANKVSGNQFRQTLKNQGIIAQNPKVPEMDEPRSPLKPWRKSAFNFTEQTKNSLVGQEITIKNKTQTTTKSSKVDVSSTTNNKVNKTTEKMNLSNTKVVEKPKVEEVIIKEVVKEKVVKVKYYDTLDFKNKMKPFEYEVKGNEVILHKIKTPASNIIIPDGVTIIKENAFGEYLNSFNTKVSSITLPYSVKKIEKEAFKNNYNIVEVIINSNIDTIEKQTFYGCGSLNNIKLPDCLKEIKEEAFKGVFTKIIKGPYNVNYHHSSFEKDTIFLQGNINDEEKWIEIEKAKQKKKSLEEHRKEDEEHKKDILANINKKVDVSSYKLKAQEDYEKFEKELLAEYSKKEKELLEEIKKLDNKLLTNNKQVKKEVSKEKDKTLEKLKQEKKDYKKELQLQQEKIDNLLKEFLKAHEVK